MIRLFINALSATAGGGTTYIRNLVPELGSRSDVHTVLLGPDNLPLPEFSNVERVKHQSGPSVLVRFWREQARLPALIRQCRADVLISPGNFALWKSPVPQILLSRNSLYLSRDFFSDLRRRREYRMWIETKAKGELAKASVRWADATIAPTQAFANELGRWTGRPIKAIHHGFDRRRFLEEAQPLSEQVQEKLASAPDAFKLLFVSHYNYYRNFETLLRAVPKISRRLAPLRIKLFLTCVLRSEVNPGSYRAESAARLLRTLDIEDTVVQLGAVPYQSLSGLYRACDLYVTPAYTETFAHPLVEAMACGLPVAASDIPVHREICGQAAHYFGCFSPEELTDRVIQLACQPDLRQDLSRRGTELARRFSWTKHLDELISTVQEVVRR